MFGSYLVELVVGLCFLFAVLGIVTSAVTETVLTVLKTRSAHLQEWLRQWSEQLLRSPEGQGRAQASFSLDALQKHPLVASHGRNGRDASYLPPDQFASAFLQLLAMPFSEACIGKDLAAAEKGLRRHVNGLHGDGLKSALHALLNDAASKATDGTNLVDALKTETSHWIESSMSRIEGWTKRHAKKFSLATALVLCLAFNVNALEVLRVLSSDPQVRSQMATTAVEYVPKVCDDEAAGKNAEEKIACLRLRTQDAISALGPLARLGIGWDAKPAFLTANDRTLAVGHFLVWLVGIACAAFAASLGGDFWFKWIGDIVRLTGYKPPRKEAAPPDVTPAAPSLLQRFLPRR